jgi:hypothetical protein
MEEINEKLKRAATQYSGRYVAGNSMKYHSKPVPIGCARR